MLESISQAQWQRIFRIAAYCVALVVIVFAIGLTTLRLLTPSLAGNRDRLQHLLSQRLHCPVLIENVSAQWQGISPQVSFNNIVLLDNVSKKPQLAVAHLDFTLDIFSSLWHWQLVTKQLHASGIDMRAHAQANNQFSIEGLPTRQQQDSSDVVAWIFLQKKMSLSGINLQWYDAAQHLIPITRLQLDLANEGADHFFRGSFALNQQIKSTLVMIANVHSNAWHPAKWRGDFYVKANDFVVNQWMQQFQFKTLALRAGQSNVETWLKFDKQRVQALRTRFAIHDLAVQSATTTRKIEFAQGDLSLRRDSLRTTLDVQLQPMNVSGFAWPNTQLTLSGLTDKNFDDLHLRCRYLRTDDVLPFLGDINFLPKTVRNYLDGLQPKAEFSNTTFDFLEKNQQWKLQTQFSNLVTQPFHDLPGVNAIRGDVDANQQQVKLNVSGEHVVLNRVDAKLPIDKLNAKLQWRQTPSSAMFSVQQLLIDSPLLRLSGDLNWQHDQRSHHPSINIDMNVALNHLHDLLTYVPKPYRTPEAITWLLDASTNQGDLIAKIAVHGDPRHFPFTEKGDASETFSMFGSLHNVDLKFNSSWPTAHAISADVSIRNRWVFAGIRHAKLSDVDFKDSQLYFRDDAPPFSVMHLSLWAREQVSTLISLVRQTPLKEKLAHVINQDVSGGATLVLFIDLPLNDIPAIKVSGDFIPQNMRLNFPLWHVALNRITGKIGFTQNAITPSHLQGDFLDNPTSFAVKMVNAGKPGQLLDVDIDGSIDAKSMGDLVSPTVQHLFTGKTAYRAHVVLPHSDKLPRQFSIQSSLLGLRSDLPSPLKKLINESLPLNFNATIYADRTAQLMLRIADRMNFIARVKAPFNVQRAMLALATDAVLPKDDTMIIRGRIPSFIAKEWSDLRDTLTHTSKQSMTFPMLSSLDVRFGLLDWYGKTFKSQHISALQTKDWLKMQFDGDQAQGSVVFEKPFDRSATLKFSRLYLQQAASNEDKSVIDPGTLPALRVDIGDFRKNKQVFGRLHLVTQKASHQMRINEFSINSDALSLTAKGTWSLVNGKPLTWLLGEAQTPSFTQLLHDWDFSPIVKASRSFTNFNLNWPAAPYAPLAAIMSGKINVQLRNGAITHLDEDTSTKVGIGKFLNILSLQSLPRRLALDFHDIKEEGFPFNVLYGNFTVNNGVFDTNDMYIDSPVAHLTVQGKIAVNTKSSDVVVNVKPHLTSSLPVIATIAGGPVVGAATWLAGRVMGEQIDKISYFTYKIMGPWSKPQIDHVNVVSKDEQHGESE